MLQLPAAPLLPNRNATRRAGTWIGLLACALLAGCASQNQSSSLTSHLNERQYDNWLFESNYRESRGDAIGELVARQNSKQAKQTKAQVASAAMELLGVRYRFGGNDPATGLDCSGLVTYAVRQSLGLKLPRRAAEMAKEGKSIKRNELQVGDLVFFNTLGRSFSHVGIYVGDNQFVHAPSSGGVVRVENMDVTYWAKRYNGARRLDVTHLASKAP